MARWSSPSCQGFTLVETAFLIIIGSSLLAIILTRMNVYIQERKYNATQEKLVVIDEGIKRYLEENDRLPCVASFFDTVDSEDFGVEQNTPDDEGCPVGPLPAGVFSSPDGRVYTGMVPVRTLNLPDEFALDGWGSRISYSVTVERSRQATYEGGSGRITVFGNDNVTPLESSVDYIIISSGPSDDGAYSVSGSQKNICPPGTLEEENCNQDSTFRDALFVNIAGSAANFDDQVLYPSSAPTDSDLPSRAVLPFFRDGKQNCPIGWTRFDPQPEGLHDDYLYCRKF